MIFQSPGSLVANNTIQTESRIMLLGVSMEDYWSLDGGLHVPL